MGICSTLQSQMKKQKISLHKFGLIDQIKAQTVRLVHYESAAGGFMQGYTRKFQNQVIKKKIGLENTILKFHSWKKSHQYLQIEIKDEFLDKFEELENLSQQDHYKLRIFHLETLHQYFDAILHKFKQKQQQFKNILQIFKRKYSDYDYGFVTKIVEAFLQYYTPDPAYVKPLNDQDPIGNLQPIQDNDVVGIIGDWGTGLEDAYGLIIDMVKRGANIIIHLGDVYYAGFKEEFDKVLATLKYIRETMKIKVRYYTIPGNHDYYTFGKQFQEFLKKANEEKYIQHASFFCLRNKSNTWQFVGMDTGYHDHIFSSNFVPAHSDYKGTYLIEQQRKWHINKIKSFAGSTILLSHHQLFSINQSLTGKLCRFGNRNSEIDYRLSQQLFEILPNVSCWIWGHAHALEFYKDYAYGIPKTRLLGNSAFQVNASQKPYQFSVPYPPPIQNRQKYIPLTDSQGFYDHTYAIINGFKNQASIKVDYWNLTSSYHNQPILRPNVFRSQLILKKPTYSSVRTNSPVIFKQQSGLGIACRLTSKPVLTTRPDLLIIKTNGQFIVQNQEIYLQSYSGDKELTNLYFNEVNNGINNGQIALQKEPKGDNSIWIIEFENQRQDKILKYGDTFFLKNKVSGKYVGRKFNESKNYFYLVANEAKEKTSLIGDEDRISRFQIFNEYAL